MNLTDVDLPTLAHEMKEYNNLSWGDRQGLTSPMANLTSIFLPHAIPILAKAKAIKGINGKYNATETIKNIKDPDIRALLSIIYSSNRNLLYYGTAAKNARYAALTPIFLYAQKEHHGIKYESWDKTDPMFKYLLSKQQEVFLDVPEEPFEFDIEAARLAHLIYGDKPVKPTSYNARQVVFSKELKYKGNDLRLKVLLQTWIANAEHRVPEAMILDLWDWDNTPEAIDEVLVEEDDPFGIVASVGALKPKKPKQEESDDIPWD